MSIPEPLLIIISKCRPYYIICQIFMMVPKSSTDLLAILQTHKLHFLPQGLCSYCSFHLECCSPGQSHHFFLIHSGLFSNVTSSERLSPIPPKWHPHIIIPFSLYLCFTFPYSISCYLTLFCISIICFLDVFPTRI